MRLVSITLALFVVLSPFAAAQPESAPKMLDVISREAVVAVAFRSENQLKSKIVALAKKTDGKIDPLTVGLLFGLIHNFVGARNVDHDAPMALMFINPDKAAPGDSPVLDRMNETLVFAMPFKRLDDMAKSFDFAKGELKPGKLIKGKSKRGRYVFARGNHLFFGENKKAVSIAAEGKALGSTLPPERRKAANSADVLVHLGARAWGAVWSSLVDELRRAVSLKDDEDAQQAAKKLVDTVAAADSALAMVRVEDGIQLSISSMFAADAKKKVKEFLAKFRGGPGSSDLKGLPKGPALLAYAAKGDGRRNVVMARALVKIALKNLAGADQIFLENDRPKLIKSFSGIWSRLRGSRAAVYHTPAEGEKERATFVSILDTEKPLELLKELTPLVELANSAGARAAKQAGFGELKFTHKPEAEKLDGKRVDWLTLSPEIVDEKVRKQLQAGLGPQWHTLRIIPLEQHLVLLLGSETNLASQAMKNIAGGAAGLADGGELKLSDKYVDAARKVEVHFFLSRLAFVAGESKNEPMPGATSLGLTVNDDRIQIDFWIPSSEIAATLSGL